MIDEPTRGLVRRRGAGRCEYCRIPQDWITYPFQIEHVVARQHHGSDEEQNLALACDRCNVFKGTNLAAIDPQTGNLVRLYNPYRDRWHEHFELRENLIVGTTDVGRATARLLQMNSDARVKLRAIIGKDAAPE